MFFGARSANEAPPPIIEPSMRYELWRQDDNGNRVRIDEFASEAEAEAARAVYEARGHKQMYWVERVKDPEDPAG